MTAENIAIAQRVGRRVTAKSSVTFLVEKGGSSELRLNGPNPHKETVIYETEKQWQEEQVINELKVLIVRGIRKVLRSKLETDVLDDIVQDALLVMWETKGLEDKTAYNEGRAAASRWLRNPERKPIQMSSFSFINDEGVENTLEERLPERDSDPQAHVRRIMGDKLLDEFKERNPGAHSFIIDYANKKHQGGKLTRQENNRAAQVKKQIRELATA